jgi:hypothetical protein
MTPSARSNPGDGLLHVTTLQDCECKDWLDNDCCSMTAQTGTFANSITMVADILSGRLDWFSTYEQEIGPAECAVGYQAMELASLVERP